MGASDDSRLIITVDVHKRDVHFAPRCESNPLDNEHPDTNSDGVQLHLVIPSPRASGKGSAAEVDHSWLLVPEEGSRHVRVSERGATGDGVSLHASWKRSPRGYRVDCQLEVAALGNSPRLPFLLDVIVNDMSPDRERRRGQLVLGGADGEFVYLRGDRHAADRHLEFVVADE